MESNTHWGWMYSRSSRFMTKGRSTIWCVMPSSSTGKGDVAPSHPICPPWAITHSCSQLSGTSLLQKNLIPAKILFASPPPSVRPARKTTLSSSSVWISSSWNPLKASESSCTGSLSAFSASVSSYSSKSGSDCNFAPRVANLALISVFNLATLTPFRLSLLPQLLLALSPLLPVGLLFTEAATKAGLLSEASVSCSPTCIASRHAPPSSSCLLIVGG